MNGVLCIIPARGGSKGIPGKNLRLVGGKPLVAHSIEAARGTRSITRVVVSTDDPQIAEVSKRVGAEVIERPIELSGDTASSEAAILHALDIMREQERSDPGIIVLLQCTSPLTNSSDIDGTVQALRDEEADCALAVTPFHYFLWGRDADGSARGINHDKRFRPMRQQRDPQFLETGAIYVMRTEGFRAAGHRFFGKTAMYAIPPERCLEIDEPADLALAEARFAALRRQHRIDRLPAHVGALILDFDGVMTDNHVTVFQDGREAVVCDRGDGWGLQQFRALGIPVIVLSTEANSIIEARCAKLQLPFRQALEDKKTALLAWLEDQGIAPQSAVFVGNDTNDLGCMRVVGCAVTPADAHADAMAAAAIILSAPGGHGAVREVTDLIREKVENERYGKNDYDSRA
jgi:YrbI family 3-deoxy-D-manno-octulosonate 8-phosphate phosphatase